MGDGIKTMTHDELRAAIESGLAAKHGEALVSTLGLGDVLGGIFGPSQQQPPTVVIHNDQNQSQGGVGGYPQGAGQNYPPNGSALVMGVPYRATLNAGPGQTQDLRITLWGLA